MTTTAVHDEAEQLPLVVCSMSAAHVAFSVQQALRTESFTRIDMCASEGVTVAAVPLLSTAAAEALVAELEDF